VIISGPLIFNHEVISPIQFLDIFQFSNNKRRITGDNRITLKSECLCDRWVVVGVQKYGSYLVMSFHHHVVISLFLHAARNRIMLVLVGVY